MDHRQFLQELAPETLARLNEVRAGPGLRHLAGHLGLIGALMAWIALGGPFWWLAIWPLGVALVFLFTLEHECTHRTPFASGRFNEVVGFGCGMVLILPFQWFRAFHMAHHRFTHDPERDPELAVPLPQTPGAWVWHVSGLPYWAGSIRVLGRLALGQVDDDFVPPRARGRIQREARVMVGLYGLLLASLFVSPLVFWVWMLPFLVGQPALRISLLAEHGRCAHVANMFENTRTTLTSRLVRFLAWNMPYHAEHHAVPTVPFHALPQLHALTRPHLKELAEGYGQVTAEGLAALKPGRGAG